MSQRQLPVIAAVLSTLAGTSVSLGAGTYGASLNLAGLNGENGFVVRGINGGDISGRPSSGGGDFNGDGFDDILIGAYAADPGGRSSAGETYVVFGGPGIGAGGEFGLGGLNGANGIVIRGVNNYDRSGKWVGFAGDVNTDGVDDVIIGARAAKPNGTATGAAYVVFGGASVGSGGALELSSLNGANGFVLRGVAEGYQTGEAVDGAGDLNDDGAADLVIGADAADPLGRTNAGESYVVYGGAGVGSGGVIDLSSLNGVNGFTVVGGASSDRCGASVAGAGDVNGDGVEDVIVGANDASTPEATNAGRAYVLFGGETLADTGVFDLVSPVSLDGSNGFRFDGFLENSDCGKAVSSAGDVNGDGIGDLVIGAERAPTFGMGSAGEAYVVYGAPGIAGGGSFRLSELDGPNGFRIYGNADLDRIGIAVGAAGDIDGDGFGDVIVSAPYADPKGQSSAGETYILFGGPSVAPNGVFSLSQINGVNGFVLQGRSTSDYSGITVHGAGDVNGDGVDDVLTTAHFADHNGMGNVGETYVVFGRLSNVWDTSAGGDFDEASNWRGGRVPLRGTVVIEPAVGVTVSGPVGSVVAEEFRIGAGIGQTTLEMRPTSLISVTDGLVIPSSAIIAGGGTLAAGGSIINDGTIDPTGLMVSAEDGLTNNAEIVLQTLTPFKQPGALSVSGELNNSTSGDIFIRGAGEISTGTILSNRGDVNIAFASATISGAIANHGLSNGAGGFNPQGRISITGGSNVVFEGDVLNQSVIALSGDSTLIVYGALSGNGVLGAGGAGGTVILEGGFNPGFELEAGLAHFDGDVQLGFGSETAIDLEGVGVADRVTSNGAVHVAGELTVNLIDRFLPSTGDTFTVVSAPGGVTGTFTDVGFPDAPGVSWELVYEADEILLRATGGITGDLSGDGCVDSKDLAIVLAAWETPGADLTGDNITDSSDLAVILAAWSVSCE